MRPHETNERKCTRACTAEINRGPCTHLSMPLCAILMAMVVVVVAEGGDEDVCTGGAGGAGGSQPR